MALKLIENNIRCAWHFKVILMSSNSRNLFITWMRGFVLPAWFVHTQIKCLKVEYSNIGRFYHSVESPTWQASQRIPGYFSSNGNCHYKTYEIQRNQTRKMGANTFTIPVEEVHLKYQFTNSGARNCGIRDFGQNKMATRKLSLSSQIRLNLGNLDMGHSNEIYS